jgi:hypothetical protein
LDFADDFASSSAARKRPPAAKAKRAPAKRAPAKRATAKRAPPRAKAPQSRKRSVDVDLDDVVDISSDEDFAPKPKRRR